MGEIEIMENHRRRPWFCQSGDSSPGEEQHGTDDLSEAAVDEDEEDGQSVDAESEGSSG